MRARSTKLRVFALGALAALLSSNALALIDVATFSHVTCPEHGELIHADGPVVLASSSADPALTPLPADEGHDHDHCPLGALARDEAALSVHDALFARVTLELPPSLGSPRAARPPLAALVLAPKCSPPSA